jgi:catechol 2,3-dioxygenase-like lactoylglutathione lyase family enzyme
VAIPARVTLITLGVADVGRATAFYEGLGWRRSSASVEGDVSFFDLGGTVLAVWGHDALADDAHLTPGAAADPGSHGLAINLASREEVDAVLAEAEAAGARVLKPAAAMSWGGYSGYFADPDGHPWEVAHNPGWPLDADGRVQLP